jgi:adenine-specific DNA-methyltransferase
MALEYLGSKRNILEFIMQRVFAKPSQRVADLFCGTGTVSGALKRAGCTVMANDNLEWCGILTKAILFNDAPPRFEGLEAQIHPNGVPQDRYLKVLQTLNDAEPMEGFVARTYSPLSRSECASERKYFTVENALKIDGVRRTIRDWSSRLTEAERSLLIADLIYAASSVSNIAGTYGCYLKRWKPRALKPLILVPSEFISGRGNGHVVNCSDAAEIAAQTRCDVVYADPPYTKRQYAAYYHVLQTIALGDSPKVTGSTGLRSWKDKASDFCHRRTAPGALKKLVSSLDCREFFLSYSEDGQIQHETILDILNERGKVAFFEIDYKRYKSSALPHKGGFLKERLYRLELGH